MAQLCLKSYIDSVIIENNHFYNGFHTTGVDINPSSGSASPHDMTNMWVRNNLFEGDPDILLRGGDRADILYDDGLNSNHIFIANQNGSGLGELSNVYIYNNIFTYATGKAITLEFTKDCYVYNNTFYKSNHSLINTQGFLYVSEGAGKPININIKNNIFYNDAPFGDVWFPSIKYDANWRDQVKIDKNLYFMTDLKSFMIWDRTRYIGDEQFIGGEYTIEEFGAYKEATNFDQNSPDPADPQFINAPEDFSVNGNSPAIGKASPDNMIKTDYYGNPRDPYNPTIGAVEFFVYDSSAANIVCFICDQQTAEATINKTNHTIEIIVKKGTDLTSIVPTIYLSSGAKVEPESGISRDFSGMQTYTVTSADGKTQTVWTIIVTIDNSTNTNKIFSESEMAIVYPNPASDKIYINLKTESNIRIIDYSGKIVYEKFDVNNIVEINNNFNKGIYLVYFSNKTGINTQKLIIQ